MPEGNLSEDLSKIVVDVCIEIDMLNPEMKAPLKRKYHKDTLTPKLRGLPVDLQKPVKVDTRTANALCSHGYRNDWNMVRKKIGEDAHYVWRIG